MDGETVMDMLDKTGAPWSMNYIPGRKKKYVVSITYRGRGITGESRTFEEAAEIAMRLAGLLKQSPLSAKHKRTIHAGHTGIRLAWSNTLAARHH